MRCHHTNKTRRDLSSISSKNQVYTILMSTMKVFLMHFKDQSKLNGFIKTNPLSLVIGAMQGQDI